MPVSVKATTSDELEAPLAVVKDTGNRVILSIRIPGLRKRGGFFFRICSFLRKHTSPFRLSENAKFGEYNLTNGSLTFVVDVYENKQALRKPGSNHQRYACRIEQFPSRINPESAEFELHQAESGDCYFILTCVKLDNLGTKWNDFLATNGTLDLAKAYQPLD